MTVDVALLSPGTTPGWRRGDAALAAQLRDAGVTCATVGVTFGRAAALRRHPVVTDLVEALAARHSAGRRPPSRATIISTVTAAYFTRPDEPYAIRFDAPAAVNRRGWEGAWQRAAERRALARAPVLLPWSAEAAEALPPMSGPRVISVGVPVDEVAGADARDIDAVTYAGFPYKRGLDLLCAAWAAIGAPGRLVIGGVSATKGRGWLARCGVPEPDSVEWLGALPREEWLSVVAVSLKKKNTARFEDHGLTPLEALSAGCALVTLPSPGPYPALGLARALAPELVSSDVSAPALAPALAAGLELSDAERRMYAQRAQRLLAPHRAPAIRRVLEEQVLPALGIAPARAVAGERLYGSRASPA